MKIVQEKWVIMDTERRVIAKGVPRSRYIVSLDDKKDKKRILYYDSRGKAEAGFKVSGFYGNQDPKKSNKVYHNQGYDLEAVKVILTLEEVK